MFQKDLETIRRLLTDIAWESDLRFKEGTKRRHGLIETCNGHMQVRTRQGILRLRSGMILGIRMGYGWVPARVEKVGEEWCLVGDGLFMILKEGQVVLL